MIPKKIHYCWFGGNPLPESARKCIVSWKKFLPGYEIIEWNESNYPIDTKCRYVKEAYKEKKWAFVSDYARFDILYQHGGIYFDTDVELIAPIDDILERGAFIGAETSDILHAFSADLPSVNSGLGLAAEKGIALFYEILNQYSERSFYQRDGRIDTTTVVRFVSDALKRYLMEPLENGIVKVQCLYIYPKEYFCPMDYETGQITITPNTRSIHHYSATWLSPRVIKWHAFQQWMKRRFGKKPGRKMFQSGIFKLVGSLYMYGFSGLLKKSGKVSGR